jgi:hypothetical protein
MSTELIQQIDGHGKSGESGNAVTKDFAKQISADDAALNAVEGIEICKWTAKKQA